MTPVNERLTANFTWGELTNTGRTAMLDTNRREAEPFKAAIVATAHLLQVVRERWGPIRVNSGFRGPSLNAAVNGSKASQHMKGEAVDFVPLNASLVEVFDWIRLESRLPYGQVILEGASAANPTWIHLSLGEPWRPKSQSRQALRAVVTNGAATYTRV